MSFTLLFFLLYLAMAAALRTVGKLSPHNTCLMLCDIQDRFRSLIHEGESIVSQANFLCRVGQELEVPIVCTEQYVKVGGSYEVIMREICLEM